MPSVTPPVAPVVPNVAVYETPTVPSLIDAGVTVGPLMETFVVADL